MAKNQFDEGTAQTKWAYFRFACWAIVDITTQQKRVARHTSLGRQNLKHPITGRLTHVFFFYN